MSYKLYQQLESGMFQKGIALSKDIDDSIRNKTQEAINTEVYDSLDSIDATLENKADVETVVDGVRYESQTHTIKFSHGATDLFGLDATPFIKDGMVNSVSIVDGNLVITFNTDAGKESILIPIGDIFDANNYYTKLEIDGFGFLVPRDIEGKLDVEEFNEYKEEVDSRLTELEDEINKPVQTIQSINQLPSNPTKGQKFRIREATIAKVKEYSDNVIPASDWRSFTADESNYIGNLRPNAQNLRSVATVCNTMGLLLLPDAWDWDADERLKYYHQEFTPATYFDEVTFNEDEWAVMEEYGAVFLPTVPFYYTEGGAAPLYHVPRVENRRSVVYASSTRKSTHWNDTRWTLCFHSTEVDGRFKLDELLFKDDWILWFCSSALRLVRDSEESEMGAFSTSESGTYIVWAKGNLQYKPSTGRCRIAPTQYSAVSIEVTNEWLSRGSAVKDIKSQDFDNWVDNFYLWGTGFPEGLTDYYDYYVEKNVIYPAGSIIQFDGVTWQWLNGYQNGNLVSNEMYNKLKKLSEVSITGSYNDLTDKPTKLSDFENDELFGKLVNNVNLPEGYKQLPNIILDGNQYIDTGYIPNPSKFGFKVDLKLFGEVTNTNAGHVFATQNKEDADKYRVALDLFRKTAGGELRIGASINKDPKLIIGQRFRLEVINKVITYYNGTTSNLGVEIEDVDATASIGLFGLTVGSEVQRLMHGTLFGLEFYENSELVKKYVPAIRLEDNVIGLFEVVDSEFFENQLEGTFGVDWKVDSLSNIAIDSNLVLDGKYVHTEVNFSSQYKNKLNGIESEAQVNKIESVSVNGTEVTPDSNKNVDISVPTRVSDLENDSNFQTESEVASTVATEVAKIVAGAPESFDTLKEMSDWIAHHSESAAEMNAEIAGKQDIIPDLEDIRRNAQANVIESISVNGQVVTPVNKLVDISVPNEYVYICKNYSELTSVTILASSHKCGTKPLISCYVNNVLADFGVSINGQGDVTISWTNATDVSAESPVTICIFGISVTPVEELHIFTVTFDPNNGDPAITMDLEENSLIVPPTTIPTKLGYDFVSWNCPPNTRIHSNVRYTASWERHLYTLRLDLNGGWESAPTDIETEHYAGDVININKPNPTKEGYTFRGWSPTVPITMPANDVTCVAQWQGASKRVTFRWPNSGYTAMTERTVSTHVGDPVADVLPEVPQRIEKYDHSAYYTFSHWMPSLPEVFNEWEDVYEACYDWHEY